MKQKETLSNILLNNSTDEIGEEPAADEPGGRAVGFAAIGNSVSEIDFHCIESKICKIYCFK